MRVRSAIVAMITLAGAATLAACGDSGGAGDPSRGASHGGGTTVTLGYFPNITHATALVGVQKGLFAKHLGGGVKLKTATFNAGPAAVEAIFSGAVDASYVGPNPSINAWAKSHGKAIKIISGAASGGAALVVKPSITSVPGLRGKKIATPQLGNTQDVALRYWLKQQGLRTTKEGGGDVNIVPQDNAQTVQTFEQGTIDGAWVPEPYASRLIIEGNGRKLVDEKTLWPGGRFVVTDLVVRTDFMREHPDLVKRLLAASVEANAHINEHPADAARTANDALRALTGKSLQPDVLAAAFKNVTFTNDPVAASLRVGAEHARQAGLLDPVDLDGIYDLRPLNEVLRSGGAAQVSDK
ncbi:MAG TPA: ABC transporter substrate-binding protein [Streptosporangiaceae bacterium]|nr:ABC transporter substrate-binding protein [Streptosporangiaceae bacterium]